MNYEDMIELISEAQRDIEEAEVRIGEARPEETAALFTAIAQAKLLAVIAKALTEMKEVSVSTVY